MPLTSQTTKSESTPQSGKDQATQAQQQGTEKLESIPRTVAGVVNEKGEIVDKSGKVIGRLQGDVDEPEKLTGEVVTEEGDVVSDLGESLAKVHIEEGNYTATNVQEAAKDAGGKKEGWNVLGKAKTAMQYGQNIQDAYGKFNKLTGGQKAKEGKPEQAASSADVEKTKDTAKQAGDQTGDHEKVPEPVKMEDKEKKSEKPTETAASKLEGDKDESTQEGVDKQAQQVTGEKDDKVEDAKDKAQDSKDKVEESKDKAADDSKEKADDSKDKLEESKDKAAEESKDTVADSKDKLEEAKDKGEDAKDSDEPMIMQSPKPINEADENVPETGKSDTAGGDKEEPAPEGQEEKGDQEKKDDLEEKGEQGQDDTQEKDNDQDKGDDQGKDDGEDKKDEESTAQDIEPEQLGEEKAEDVAEDAKSGTGQVPEGTDVPVGDKEGDKTDEAQAEVGDKGEEALDTAGEAKDEAKAGVDESQQEVEAQAGEEGDKKPDEDEMQIDEKGGAALEGAEGAKDEAQEAGEGAKDEAQEAGEEAKDEAEEAGEAVDLTVLKGTKVNKAGNLVNSNGDIIGRLVEGDAKQLLGKTCDDQGQIWNESGKVIGKAEPISEKERDEAAKDFAPFENFPDAVVEADGRVTSQGKQVGEVVEGDPKRMKGSHVDEDGDILDRRGNVIGKAKAWDEPEEVPEAEVDKSLLAGKRVNKAGNVVDSHGQIFGRVVEGDIKSLVGRMCDREGNIMSESGEKIGKAELVSESEREGSREGPFAELTGCTVAKDGKVVTPSGEVVGRLISGDAKTLYGRAVDEDGDVLDKNGNVLGKAERWEEPEVEKKKNPLAGRKVNREGNVVDEDGNIIGKLTSGDLGICAGKEIDEDGDVVNSKGITIGHVNLLEDIPPEPEPTESAEDKEKREQAEKDRKLAGQLAASIEQSLDKLRPILSLITDKVDKAERTPKDELDEEQLVREVRPLIEEGSKILTETNGIVRGMDPDGRIQRNAKQKSGTKEATPEEHHLAELLKELTGSVTQTIDNARRKIDGMPHAKKELNPLWGLLSEPLFQIIAAVGLLLNGVLGLVGRLLSGLGLGGLVSGLLGGLGLNKVLEGLGLGSAVNALTGKKSKK